MVPISKKIKYKENLDEPFCELVTDLKLNSLFNRFSRGTTKTIEDIIDKVIQIKSVDLIDDPEYGGKTYVVIWCFSENV